MTAENVTKTVAELAVHVGGRVAGDGSVPIKSVASLERAQEHEIAFVADAKLLEAASRSRASCLIVPEAAPDMEGKCLIKVKRPKLAFALIAELLHPPKKEPPSIHPTAIIAESASLGEDVFIGAYVSIGERVRIAAGAQLHHGACVGDDVSIGRDSVLHPHVVLYDGVTVGERVILHASVIVGADGFGYVPDEENLRHKFPQIGTVVIEDEVEIGAATCIDRGALGETRIGRASKIDNLVQVAHNVQIGARVVIASQTGISGSTVIEDDAVIGGQVGFGDHARVQSGAVIGSKAGVLPGKIVRPGVWWGIPIQPLEDYKRLNAHLKRLPQLREEVKELKRQLKELREKLDSQE
jgi:UDP-3-O-[3-hydroxymyristoyl] glucosamine N-acyltransferase